MIIDTSEKPFPFLLIRNFYSESELKYIFKELDFLTSPFKFLNADSTYSASDSSGNIKKSGYGLFLDDIYNERRISNILTLNRKIFNKEVKDNFSSLHSTYNAINFVNVDSTLINYYENSDKYDSHIDISLFTFVTFFFKEPKKFKGGNFIFSEYNYEIDIENNMVVGFPSDTIHEVTQVELNQDKVFSGYGRYSMTQFLFSKIESMQDLKSLISISSE